MQFPRFFSGFLSIVLTISFIFQGMLFPIKKAEASKIDSLIKSVAGSAAVGLASCGATMGVSFATEKLLSLQSVPSSESSQIGSFIKENCMDPIARSVSQQLLAKLTENTINWINTGFNGNPFYIKDFDSYVTSVADNSIKSTASKISQSNSPFSAKISSSLIISYVRSNQETTPDFTLDKIVGDNWQQFSDGDFKQGGWDAWLATTILPQNNQIGSSFLASDLATKQIEKKVSSNNQDIAQNDGFLSMKKCVEKEVVFGQEECKKYETVTPGSVISEQLKKVSLTGNEQLQNTEDPVDAALNKVFTALLNNLIQKGVSSLTTNVPGGSNAFGGYGSNSLGGLLSGTGAQGAGWVNAAGSQEIVLEDLPNYLQIQQEYAQKSTQLQQKISTLVPLIYQADFCLPGPRPTWKEEASSQLSYLSSSAPSSIYALINYFQNIYGLTLGGSFGLTYDPTTVRNVIVGTMEGRAHSQSGAYLFGYKDYINQRFSGASQIPIASAINKEYTEIESYNTLKTLSGESYENAMSSISSINYISNLFNQLPDKNDPTYADKRKELQKKADNILPGIYSEENVDLLDSQIQEIDSKIDYVSNPSSGLIAECQNELLAYPSVAKERRPYPAQLLPSGVNYQTSQTFLPGVTIGSDGSFGPTIFISDYMTVDTPAMNPSIFEQKLGIY
ncbi:MAG TPA: hypothetical protein PK886_01875 [Candidatus Paceibacterota bacterium]|nr:hypothetical protein [Candidatus Paceibacterota bacterium]